MSQGGSDAGVGVQHEVREQNQHEEEELKYLNELQTQIRGFPPLTEIISSLINPSSEKSEENDINDFLQQESDFINWIKKNIDRMLIIAAKFEKDDIVDFMLKCGLEVNAVDVNGKSAADYAWTNKNCKILFLLLQADSFFPAEFNVNELNDDLEGMEIKELVDRRNILHETIRSRQVEDVKILTSNENSNLYLNTNNESAAYIALKHKKFATYAYLKSIGAEFGKNEKKAEIDKTFEMKDKIALQDAMDEYFPAAPDAHIHYLISKSRSHKPVKTLTRRVKKYYSELDKIPEVSIILKVIQFADYLDIVFDFDEDEISSVNPLVSPANKTRGATLYQRGRIYIAAGSGKRTTEEVLGTIAHELAHMAMQMLYGNDCNPYGKADEESARFFRNLKREIHIVSGEPSKVLLNAISSNYEAVDHDSELIVRVPQILAQFKDGKDWLEEQVNEFLNFYNDNIMPKCQDFIRESVILKPKSIIKSINESVGEILKLKKCTIFFNDALNLFKNNDKNIFVIKVENTFLGVMKVLQRLYGKGYVNFHSHFLVLKFDNFVSQVDGISRAFLAEGCDWLITEVTQSPTERELDEVFDNISVLLETKPQKKVIFVARPNVAKNLCKMSEDFDLLDFCDEMSDNNLNFNDLEVDSQEKILKKRVNFQGKPMYLKQLFNDPELCNLITAEIIEFLLQGRKVNVGNKILGLSSLEGPYADIVQEMDFQSFFRYVTKSKNEIFIVRSKRNEEAVEYFRTKFGKDWTNIEFSTNKTYDFEKKIRHEKIILVNDRFESKDFKNFCTVHSENKCYFIDENDLTMNSFLLLEFYNPNFYVERSIKKMSIEAGTAIKVIQDSQFQEILLISNSSELKTYNFKKFSNVKCFDGPEAEKNFEILSRTGSNVHWFKMKNDRLFWNDSFGSIANLRNLIKKYTTETESGKNKHNLMNGRVAEYSYSEDPESDAEIEEFSTENSEIFQKRILLLADNAGTGKSTTLAKLYEEKQIADKHWIIRINLKDHLMALRDEINSKALNIEIIRFLQKVEPNLKNDLNENLLKMILTPENKFSKCLLLAFDGFDEVLDKEDREKVLNVLKFLKKETGCKIWITTRLQYKSVLEDELETFAIGFHPFNIETQKSFIVRYLENRLHLILKEELFCKFFENKKDSPISVFIQQLLLKMSEIFQKGLWKFIGIPLQLQLILSGSVKCFKNWTENGGELNFDYLGVNLMDIYENFTKQKYEVYMKKANLIEKTRYSIDEEVSENYNKELAESLIREQKVVKPEPNYKEIILLIGIIQSQNDENYEFLHFTFREYYFAVIFAEYIFSKPLVLEKMIFLFQEVFVREEFQMIRQFLNAKLKDAPSKEKMDEFQDLLSINKYKVLKPYTTWKSNVLISAEEGLENILKFICSNYFYKISEFSPPFKVTNILNRPVFQAAVIFENINYLIVLLEISKELAIHKWEKSYYEFLIGDCFYSIASSKNFYFMATFWEKIQQLFGKEEIPRFLKAVHEEYKIFEFKRLYISLEMLNFLLNIAGEYFSKEEQMEIIGLHWRSSETVSDSETKSSDVFFRVATSEDSRFMKLLFDKSKEIMKSEEEYDVLISTYYFGKTILHAAAENRNLDIVKLVLSKVGNVMDVANQADFITLPDDMGLTALYLAVKTNNIEVVKLLTAEGQRILRTEEFLKYMTGYNRIEKTFQLLPYNGANTESIILLFEIVKSMVLLKDPSQWLKTNCVSGSPVDPDHFFEAFQSRVRWTEFGYNSSGYFFHHACLFNDSKMINFIIANLKIEDITQLFLIRIKTGQTCLNLAIWPKGTTEFLELLFKKMENYLLPEAQFELMKMTMNHLYEQNSKHRNLINLNSLKLLSDKMRKLTEAPLFIEPIELLFAKVEALPACDHFYVQLFCYGPSVLLNVIQIQSDRISKLIFDKFEEVLDVENQRAFFMTINEERKTCLHLAAKKNRIDFMTFFFYKAKQVLPLNCLRDLLLHTDVFGNTVLHEAAKNNQKDTSVLELLMQKMDEVLPTEISRQFLMMRNMYNQNALHVLLVPYKANLNESMRLLLKKATYILTCEEQRGFLLMTDMSGNDTPEQFFIRENSGVFKFVLEISEKILNLSDQKKLITKQWDSILSLYGSKIERTTNMEPLLQHMEKVLPVEIQREILMRNNRDQITALHFFLNPMLCNLENVRVNVCEALVGRLERILTPEQQYLLFMMKNKFQGALLHTAILHNSDLNLIKLIIEKGKVMLKQNFCHAFMIKNNRLESIVHIAVVTERYDNVKYIINEGKRILGPEIYKEFFMMTDQHNHTVLHVAATNKSSDYKLRALDVTSKETWNKNCASNITRLLLKKAEKFFTPEERRRFHMMKDNRGRTALHLAAELGEVESVNVLLQDAEKCFLGEDLKQFAINESIPCQTDAEKRTVYGKNRIINKLIIEFFEEKLNSDR